MGKHDNSKKKGPSGMTKRTKFIKHEPEKPPPSIGDIVWYTDRKGAWRTGRLLRVIDRGKDWGKCEVKDSVAKMPRTVAPENVRAI